MGPQSQRATNSTLAATQVSMIGAAAATTLARAIIKAVRNAAELHGIPAASQ
jgi:L-aminopeptidase/D-esterase-like protein